MIDFLEQGDYDACPHVNCFPQPNALNFSAFLPWSEPSLRKCVIVKSSFLASRRWSASDGKYAVALSGRSFACSRKG